MCHSSIRVLDMRLVEICIGCVLSGLVALAPLSAFAQTAVPNPGGQNINRIVEDVPGPNERLTRHLIHVSATKTPSGLPVPRFVSLKYSKSYGRTGPSRKHPIAWVYHKRGLPVIVVAETPMWRKVRDISGTESWMHKGLLSGKKMVLARTETILRSKPRSDARKRAIIAKGALLEMESCTVDDWCKFSDKASGLSGYAPRSLFWGAGPL